MKRTLCILALAAVVWGWASPALAQVPFHFTVTADPRDYHATFGAALSAINTLPAVNGPGAFHVTVGDYDNTPAENRQQIDANFGANFKWYPVVGNHETEDADMNWARAEYTNGNGLRTPLKNFTNQNGPAGSVESTYSWDYGNAHFVSINEYWNGGTAAGSDVATDGDVVPQLLTWLQNDLNANTKPFVFVFGHEPAYLPAGWNHYGDSLDEHPANRDAFWQTLQDHNVTAYICGHTHTYRAYQYGTVWQVDAGNAGNGGVHTFLDIKLSADHADFNTWSDNGGVTYTQIASWIAVPEPATLSLLALGGLALIRRKR